MVEESVQKPSTPLFLHTVAAVMELADERTGLVARQGPLRVVGTATRITTVHGLYAVVDSKQEFQNGPEPATCSYAVVLPAHVTVSSLVRA